MYEYEEYFYWMDPCLLSPMIVRSMLKPAETSTRRERTWVKCGLDMTDDDVACVGIEYPDPREWPDLIEWIEGVRLLLLLLR